MKKIVLTLLSVACSAGMMAQMQIDNSDLEQWESVPGGSEPVNWNSFLTASGGLAGMAADQMEESTDVRPGSTGTKSAKIWSRAVVGLVANGNLTLGRINMGNMLADHPDNHNKTIVSDPAFHQVMTDKPDSIVFWVKFTPNGHNENARMKATIHDNYDYKDPEDATSTTHVVGSAVLNYPSTGGEWVRKAAPFEYNGPATDAAFILVTFATNETPGGGKKDDVVWIDDIELIYNELSVDKNELLNAISIYPNPVKETLTIDNVQNSTEYSIHSVLGEVIMTGTLNQFTNKIETSKIQNGVYFLRLSYGQSTRTMRFIKN